MENLMGANGFDCPGGIDIDGDFHEGIWGG